MRHSASRYIVLLAILSGLAVLAPGFASADEPVQLILKDHRFAPADISVPANERFRIEITNQDATPAEFESGDLRAEKIVVPGSKITVMAGPLKPGAYTFVDDYHPDTAKGTVTATQRQATE